MPAYPGSFEYLDERGGALAQGACQFSIEKERCAITPSSGVPVAFDLGDVDRVRPGEWDLELALYTGRVIRLRKFGPAFGRMQAELMEAWRDRTVACLLLEDLEEVGRYDGVAAGFPSEIRIYRSNIAVLPLGGVPVQLRLADVDSVSFDEAAYSVTVRAGDEQLVISKLAKKTDEFRVRLTETLDALRMRSAEAMHSVFPFLGPDQLQRLLTAMPEGRSVKLASLSAIDPRLPDALAAKAVGAHLRPYFDALRERAVADSLMAGYKFIRAEDAEPAEMEGEDLQVPAAAEPSGPSEEEEAMPLFFWFFFPFEEPRGSGRYANLAAWEAGSGSGRATYFFRLLPPNEAGVLADPARAGAAVEAAVRQLTAGLASVNFRREPIYLPDESLERQPRYRRYAIGRRKLPVLARLRASMRGRAVHSALEAWMAQVESARG